MAVVDLYGADAGSIRNQYKTSLRRDASDDEVTGWLSGSYGGGGLNDWLRQIDDSHEAQQYKAPKVVGQPGPEINGPLSPQQPAGGYPGFNTPAPAPMPTPFQGQPNRPGYQDLNFWQSQGVQAQDIFDTTTGQIKPGWARTGQGYERTGGGAGAPQGGNFQSWFLSRMGSSPSSPEALGAMEAELNRYGIRLQKDSYGTIRGRMYLPDGSAVDVVNPNGWGQPWTWINRGTGGGGGHSWGVGQGVGLPNAQFNDPHTKLLEDLMLSRINALQQGTDPGYQQLMSYLDQRFKDLQGPGRTGAEQEVIRTQALDPIESDRQAARQRVVERLAARGITMESGVAQQALLEVDKAFDGMRAATQGSMAADELQRREGRNQYAEGLAASMYEIPQARNREAIGYAGGLADLGPQRLQLAMQALGMGGSPTSNFSSLMQLANLNQSSALINQNRSAQMWSGLGSIAAILANAGR